MTDEEIMKIESHLIILANVVIDRVIEDKRKGRLKVNTSKK